MAKKGIRVKDLSTQLGISARQLIDRCRAEGLPVQNSITKIPPALEQVIRDWFTSKSVNEETSFPGAPEPAFAGPMRSDRCGGLGVKP